MNKDTEMFISKSLLYFALETYFKQKINILSFTTADLIADGENYTSELKRVSISYTHNDSEIQTFTAIAKYLPQNKVMAQCAIEMKYFENEFKMYDALIPKFAEMAHRQLVAPRAYYTSREPSPMLLLEDLSISDYKIVDRIHGLGLDDCLRVIEKLAYFHAASRVLYEKDSSTFETFNESLLSNTFLQRVMSVSYEEILKLCQNVLELNGYVNKLKSARDGILNGINNAHKINSKFKVLNHGDLWINNIMFLRDQDGNVKDVLFIDFQAPCFTSPWLDLYYFLAGSISLATWSDQKLIVDHYFLCLVNNLRKLQVRQLPDRKDFDEDFRLMAPYGFAASISSLALITSNPIKGAPFQNFLEDDTKNGFRYHCYSNEKYIKYVFHYLPYYDQLGIFNEN